MDIVQLKTAEEIRDDILVEISAQTGISDQNLGSVVRTLAYALGVELDELYFQLWRGIKGTYIKTASGTALDHRASDFSLTRSAATKAIGHARFTGTPATTVPLGTQVAAPATTVRDEIVFATTQVGVVGGGGTIDVPIEAVVAGSAGNVSASTITYLKTSVSGISAVTNPAATALGRDKESDDELRERILRTIDGLSRGTIPSILHGAIDFELQEVTLYEAIDVVATEIPVYEDLNLSPFSGQVPHKLSLDNGTEVVTYLGIDTSSFPHKFTGVTRGVVGAAVAHAEGVSVKEYVPAGRGYSVTSASLVEFHGIVYVYIDDGTTLGPCSELVDLVQRRLVGDGTDRDPGYRGAGISLSVYARTVILVNVTVTLQVSGSYDYWTVIDETEDAIIAYINGRKVGETVRAYDMAEAIMGVAGVEDVTSLDVDGSLFDGSTSANVLISPTQVARTDSSRVTVS